MRKFAILLGSLISTAVFAQTPLQIFVTAKTGIPNQEYYVDIDNCFANPLTYNCEGNHYHHLIPIMGSNISFYVARDEPVPAGKVMYSIVGIRHPHTADRPVICVTKFSSSTNKAFVPSHVTKIHLTVYKTQLGFGPERCDIFYYS